ncbi:MAG: site-2 protease family protein [Pirellula sp.]
MSSANAFIDDAAQEARYRFRTDIEWVQYADLRKWVAKDPLSVAFFYFSEIEHAAARLFDGHRSLKTVEDILKRAFPRQGVSEGWLHVLLHKWRQSNLLIPTKQTANRFRPKRSSMRSFISQALLSPLAIRVPLVKPKGYSLALEQIANVLFSKWIVLFAAVLGFAIVFVVASSILSQPRLLLFDATQFQGNRWVLLFLSYVAIKSLHELGHVLACVRWGANCREIGVMFLFFTPCLYCDTTDCWKLQSRWKRAAIGAGGIYVEFLIAIVAGMVWLLANDGLIRSISGSAMLVCTLGTILVNGNPFFRYDGYYVLSDVWGVPNLSEQSTRALNRSLVLVLGGGRLRRDEYDANPWILVAFALASMVYRIMMLGLILWFAWNALVPLGLGFIAVLAMVTTVIAFAHGTTRFFGGLMSEFFAPVPIKRVRFAMLILLLVSALSIAATVPIPGYVRARGYLDFADSVPIFIKETARVKSISDLQSRFQLGEVLFELESPEKQLESLELRGEIAIIAAKIELLKKNSTNDAASAYEIPTQLEVLRELQAQLELLQPQLDSLVQTAPFEGRFLPTSNSVLTAIASPSKESHLAHLMSSDRVGCMLEKGSLVGWFTNHKKPFLRVLVPESEMKSLVPGTNANYILDSRTHDCIAARVIRLAPDPVDEVPAELAHEPWLVASRDAQGKLKPSQPHYEVRLEPTVEMPTESKGAVATVQFQVANRTALEHLIRYVRLTFRSNPN